MKLRWTPIVAAAVVVLAGCEQSSMVAPSAQSALPNMFEGPLAVQTGNGAPSGGHYTLNIIGVPKDKTADMTDSSGHRIFVPLERTVKIMLKEGDYLVVDGNGTDGVASFQLPNPDPDGDGTTVYSVFARALGTPGGKSITTTCVTDPLDPTLDLCSPISLELERKTGPSKFENVSKYLLYIFADVTGDGVLDRVPLFDKRLEGYFWEYDNTGLKLAQLRFYECSTSVSTDPDAPQTTLCFQ